MNRNQLSEHFLCASCSYKAVTHETTRAQKQPSVTYRSILWRPQLTERVCSDLPIRPSQTQPWPCICKCSGMLGNVQGRQWRASTVHSCYLMLSLTPDQPRHVAAFSVRDLETRPFNCQHLRIRLSSVYVTKTCQRNCVFKSEFDMVQCNSKQELIVLKST